MKQPRLKSYTIPMPSPQYVPALYYYCTKCCEKNGPLLKLVGGTLIDILLGLVLMGASIVQYFAIAIFDIYLW